MVGASPGAGAGGGGSSSGGTRTINNFQRTETIGEGTYGYVGGAGFDRSSDATTACPYVRTCVLLANCSPACTP